MERIDPISLWSIKIFCTKRVVFVLFAILRTILQLIDVLHINHVLH